LDQARAETQNLRTSGHRIDDALPDRETARSLRARVAPRIGYPYRPREAPAAAPDTFTPAARAVLVEASAHACHGNHDSIGAEHLLRAVLHDRTDRPARILASMGAEIGRLCAVLDALAGHSARLAQGEMSLTPHARAIVSRAVDEARRLHHPQVRPEHFLLSLTHDRAGLAIAALRRLGLDPARVYAHTRAAIASEREI
jgi:ATP-dependent Clp protease ATP-binding subunit ClpA